MRALWETFWEVASVFASSEFVEAEFFPRIWEINLDLRITKWTTWLR
ncbi:hypothetical protein CyaNS01_01913 [Cyanobium sp. NS01]|nr:hypothetical protein CyaNS01_01913 [Cyanobium sp. NS01]